MPDAPRLNTSRRWPRVQPAGRIAYVNGRYVAHPLAGVHIEDRGLQLGDSIYEVIHITDGRFRDEEEHLDRMEHSLGEIGMAMPMARNALKLVLREVTRRNCICNGLIYFQVTRGALRREHPIPQDTPRPTLIVTAHRINPAGLALRYLRGVTVLTTPDIRWGRCDIKTTQLLANVLAKTQARRAGAYEALFVDGDGYVTEGASTTAWIVTSAGEVVTRQLSHAVLPGVTRRVILDVAATAQLKFTERTFTPHEVRTAKEAFLSSATGPVVPIVGIDGQPVGNGKPGPLSARIRELYLSRTEDSRIRG